MIRLHFIKITYKVLSSQIEQHFDNKFKIYIDIEIYGFWIFLVNSIRSIR